MSDAARLFAKIDKDKSGTIDADELLKHLLEAGVEADEISRAFAAILSSEKDRGITTAFRSSAQPSATRAGSPYSLSFEELRTGLP